MNTKVSDLMVQRVVTAAPSETVAHARALMERERIQALPLVDGDGALVGIISTTDLAQIVDGSLPLRRVMSHHPYTIPQYDDISSVARLMRNKHIHHVVVTHEKQIVGMLSSFDLLRLVEDHRFVMKPGPTPSKKSSR